MALLIDLINLFFQVYIILVVIRAILPWIPHNRFNPLIAFVCNVTDPILLPLRKGLPPMRIGLDASPFVAIVLLWILQQIIVSLLTVI